MLRVALGQRRVVEDQPTDERRLRTNVGDDFSGLAPPRHDSRGERHDSRGSVAVITLDDESQPNPAHEDEKPAFYQFAVRLRVYLCSVNIVDEFTDLVI